LNVEAGDVEQLELIRDRVLTLVRGTSDDLVLQGESA